MTTPFFLILAGDFDEYQLQILAEAYHSYETAPKLRTEVTAVPRELSIPWDEFDILVVLFHGELTEEVYDFFRGLEIEAVKHSQSSFVRQHRLLKSGIWTVWDSGLATMRLAVQQGIYK